MLFLFFNIHKICIYSIPRPWVYSSGCPFSLFIFFFVGFSSEEPQKQQWLVRLYRGTCRRELGPADDVAVMTVPRPAIPPPLCWFATVHPSRNLFQQVVYLVCISGLLCVFQIALSVSVFWVLGERDFSSWPDTPIATKQVRGTPAT